MSADVEIMNAVDQAIKRAGGDLRQAIGNVQELAARMEDKDAVLRALACNYAVMQERLRTMMAAEKEAA